MRCVPANFGYQRLLEALPSISDCTVCEKVGTYTVDLPMSETVRASRFDLC